MKALVFAIAAIMSFAFFYEFGSGIRADQERYGADDRGISMGRCVRQFERMAAGIDGAERLCGCMLDEFDNRGLAVTDAFGDSYEEMVGITQSCAQVEGIPLGA